MNFICRARFIRYYGGDFQTMPTSWDTEFCSWPIRADSIEQAYQIASEEADRHYLSDRGFTIKDLKLEVLEDRPPVNIERQDQATLSLIDHIIELISPH